MGDGLLELLLQLKNKIREEKKKKEKKRKTIQLNKAKNEMQKQAGTFQQNNPITISKNMNI